MENLDELTREQLIEKINQLENEKSKLDIDLSIANYKLRKMDYIEKTLKVVGVAIEFLNFKEKE